MEFNKQKNKDPKEYTSKKPMDLTDITIMNTPQPQASSTVDRRSLMQGKLRKSSIDEQNSRHRQLNFDQSNSTNYTEESSLGIIPNISSLLNENNFDEIKSKKDCLEHERELARLLLKKCGEPAITVLSRPDKENNVNSNNLQKITSVCNYSNIKNKQPVFSNQVQNKKQSDNFDKKSTDTNSIVFEPSEITARSSELNKTPEKTETFSQQNFSGISYNSNVAEMMAQYGDEEFMSGSKAGSQILADEISWRKNKLGALPVHNANDKERLELSCFSGVIGDIDLTVDGGRISVGEFFKRNCGGIGQLSTANSSNRPSLGLDVKSPQKKGKIRALVDNTLIPEDDKEVKTADCTKERSVMSLSNIAQILQDVDSETPTKLVDKILDANKRKRRQKTKNNNCTSNTYTIKPPLKSSLSVSASTSLLNNNSENILIQINTGNNLSLDSKNINNLELKSYNELLDKANFLDPNLRKLLELNLEDSLLDKTLIAKQAKSKTFEQLSIQEIQQKDLDVSVPRAEYNTMPPSRQLSQLSNNANSFSGSSSINNESSLIHDREFSDLSDPTFTKSNSLSRENTFTNSIIKNNSFDTKKVQIGKRTEELCTCLVGIYKEANFELYNGTDRWILCNLKLNQIQGEKDNINFNLPDSDILIKPDEQKFFKIGATMPRMGKLTIAYFHIPCSDMVTRTNWYMKHLMCFVPEEPNIKISTSSENNTLNFQMITEDTSNTLPITFENGNSIEVPVLLRLSQREPQLFSIGGCFDDTVNSVVNKAESIYLTLKSRQLVTVNIDFKGMSLQSFGEKVLKKGVYNVEAKLIVAICFKENEEHFIKEVPLIGAIGTYKLDVLDTQFPLFLQPRVGKIINLKNSGCIVVSATADIVQSKENQSECRDFCICPNKIVLNGGEKSDLQITYKPENNKTDNERNAMIRIVVGNKLSFYPIIGEKVVETDQSSADSFNLQRAETPQYLRNINSPTSPHSLIFNRSGTSGRNSPGSTASGGVIINETAIPIRATHTAVVWGSIKVGKSDIKQLTIRNTSNNKIKLFVTIKTKDQNFKFVRDRHSTSSFMTLSLQGTESKTLSVMFAPNLPQAAAGKIIFSYYSSVRENRELSGFVKVIQLFGYGGCGKIQISQGVKDTSGQMWLSLGKLNSEGILHAKIKLHNTGDLTCFAKVKLIPKALYPSVLSNWHIEPIELLLGPDQIQWVTLDFRPRKDDLTSVHQTGVIHVGTLKITHGDEPTRLRIRRLYKKLKDSGQLHDKIDGYIDEFRDVIQPICKAFPGEVFTQDLKLIGDSVQNLGDLCKGIIQNEVKLTIETQDESISMLQDNMDDSQTFYSLCSDHNNETHFGVESFLPTN